MLHYEDLVDTISVLVLEYKYYGSKNKKMDKEKSPVERLHDDIRHAVKKIEDDMDDEMVRIHTIENDDAG